MSFLLHHLYDIFYVTYIDHIQMHHIMHTHTDRHKEYDIDVILYASKAHKVSRRNASAAPRDDHRSRPQGILAPLWPTEQNQLEMTKND